MSKSEKQKDLLIEELKTICGECLKHFVTASMHKNFPEVKQTCDRIINVCPEYFDELP